MKLSKHTLILFLGVLCLGVLQSCSSDDDEDDNTPPSTTYPNTLTFSHIDNKEFKMWTNGEEVNTSNLNIQDFIDPEDYHDLSGDFYSSIPGITFTEDSVFAAFDGEVEGYPYTISNDSIYSVFSWEGEELKIFFAVGNQNQLYLPQSFYRVVVNQENMFYEISSLEPGHYTFDEVAYQLEMSSPADLHENDTLIIFNERVHYD